MEHSPTEAGKIATVQDIFREHGWPDLEKYRKRECLEELQRPMLEQCL
jgi:hypothetical protein